MEEPKENAGSDQAIATIPIRRLALRTARLAVAITGQSLTDFVTEAVESKAKPIVTTFRAEKVEASVS